MPKIHYIQPGGETRIIEATVGDSVMHAAIINGVSGITAECGGACSCATCHIYVDESWKDRLPAIGDDEEGMLECTASERRPNSRLSCQITVTDDLEGLIVNTPETQS